VARAVVLFVAVLLAQYGYSLVGDAIDRRWTFYVLRGVEGVAMASLLFNPLPWPSTRARVLAGFSAALAVVEEAQTSICGVAQWRADVADDLCVSWLGGHAFAAVAAGAVSALIVFKRGPNV